MIRLESVTKSYSTEVTALRDASFEVAKGEFVFLVGPSGSGKSTILRLMNRQEQPERGEVWVAGKDINAMPDSKVPFLRRNIGNIFQDYKLLLNKMIRELGESFRGVEGVREVAYAQDVFDVVSRVSQFIRVASSSAFPSPARSSIDR